MIEINLIPDVKQELLRAQSIRTKVIATSVLIGMAAVGVLVLLLIYFGIQMARGAIADNAIKDGSTKFMAVEDLSKTLAIQNQLNVLSTLNDDKNIYSRLYQILGAIVPAEPNNVTISDLSIDSANGYLKMNGQAANSYIALEIFKKTIEGTTVKYKNSSEDTELQSVPMASEVSISDISYGEDTTGAKVLRFTIGFKYAPELFSPKSKNVSVLITIDGNITDSYLNIPRSVFADRAEDIEGEQ